MAVSYGRQILEWRDMTIYYTTSYNDRHKEHFQFMECTWEHIVQLHVSFAGINDKVKIFLKAIQILMVTLTAFACHPVGNRTLFVYSRILAGARAPESTSAVEGSVEKVRDGSRRRWKVRKPRKDGAGGGKRKKSKKNIYISRRQTI